MPVMRLKRERISALAREIVDHLAEKKLLSSSLARENITADIDRVLYEEISVEDRLNDEVRELLKSYESQIRTGALDYQKMFTLTKHKLAKERGLIL